MGEQAHKVSVLSVDEASGLLTVHPLGKMAVQEGIGYIQLMHRLGARDRQLEHNEDRAWFNNWGEGVSEVHARALPKTTNYPLSLVAPERIVRASLVAKHPVARDDVGSGRAGGHGTSCHVRLRCRASNSSCIAASQWGSRRAARAEVGTGEGVDVVAVHTYSSTE